MPVPLRALQPTRFGHSSVNLLLLSTHIRLHGSNEGRGEESGESLETTLTTKLATTHYANVGLNKGQYVGR